MSEDDSFVPCLEVEFPYPEPRKAHREQKGPTGDLHLLVRRPAVQECFCIEHGPSAELAYLRHSYKKNETLYDKLQGTRKTMAQRANRIIDHRCPDMGAKMDVLYAIDFAKRGHDNNNFKPLAPASNCKVGTPIRPLTYEIPENVIINPDFHSHLPKTIKIVAAARPLQFGVNPKNVSSFYQPYERGNTEYEEAYSIPAKAIIRHSQFYQEPHPSTRRRVDDFHH